MARVVPWQRFVAAVLVTVAAAGGRYAAADDGTTSSNLRVYSLDTSSRPPVRVIRPTVFDQVQADEPTPAPEEPNKSPSDESQMGEAPLSSSGSPMSAGQA